MESEPEGGSSISDQRGTDIPSPVMVTHTHELTEQLSKAKEGAKIIDVEDPEREENETKTEDFNHDDKIDLTGCTECEVKDARQVKSMPRCHLCQLPLCARHVMPQSVLPEELKLPTMICSCCLLLKILKLKYFPQNESWCAIQIIENLFQQPFDISKPDFRAFMDRVRLAQQEHAVAGVKDQINTSCGWMSQEQVLDLMRLNNIEPYGIKYHDLILNKPDSKTAVKVRIKEATMDVKFLFVYYNNHWFGVTALGMKNEACILWNQRTTDTHPYVREWEFLKSLELEKPGHKFYAGVALPPNHQELLFNRLVMEACPKLQPLLPYQNAQSLLYPGDLFPYLIILNPEDITTGGYALVGCVVNVQDKAIFLQGSKVSVEVQRSVVEEFPVERTTGFIVGMVVMLKKTDFADNGDCAPLVLSVDRDIGIAVMDAISGELVPRLYNIRCGVRHMRNPPVTFGPTQAHLMDSYRRCCDTFVGLPKEILQSEVFGDKPKDMKDDKQSTSKTSNGERTRGQRRRSTSTGVLDGDKSSSSGTDSGEVTGTLERKLVHGKSARAVFGKVFSTFLEALTPAQRGRLKLGKTENQVNNAWRQIQRHESEEEKLYLKRFEPSNVENKTLSQLVNEMKQEPSGAWKKWWNHVLTGQAAGVPSKQQRAAAKRDAHETVEHGKEGNSSSESESDGDNSDETYASVKGRAARKASEESTSAAPPNAEKKTGRGEVKSGETKASIPRNGKTATNTEASLRTAASPPKDDILTMLSTRIAAMEKRLNNPLSTAAAKDPRFDTLSSQLSTLTAKLEFESIVPQKGAHISPLPTSDPPKTQTRDGKIDISKPVDMSTSSKAGHQIGLLTEEEDEIARLQTELRRLEDQQERKRRVNELTAKVKAAQAKLQDHTEEESQSAATALESRAQHSLPTSQRSSLTQQHMYVERHGNAHNDSHEVSPPSLATYFFNFTQARADVTRHDLVQAQHQAELELARQLGMREGLAERNGTKARTAPKRKRDTDV